MESPIVNKSMFDTWKTNFPSLAVMLNAFGLTSSLCFNIKYHVRRIKLPILYLHGDRDEQSPYGASYDLLAESKNCKRKSLVKIEGAPHNGLWLYKEEYFPAIWRFINLHGQ